MSIVALANLSSFPPSILPLHLYFRAEAGKGCFFLHGKKYKTMVCLSYVFNLLQNFIDHVFFEGEKKIELYFAI